MSKPTKPDKKPTAKPDEKKLITKTDAPIVSKLDGSKATKPPPDAATRPPRTVTVPEHLRGAWTQGTESVIALAVDGDDRIYELPRAQAEITVGREADCDIVITSPWVSRKHFVVQRRGARTYVVDKGSKNGIVAGEVVETEFEAPPGKRFLLGGQLLVVALNEAMRQELPVVGQLVCLESERDETGGQDRPSRLRVLSYALDVMPILITGEAGCDHDRLARAIHAMSRRRAHNLVTLSSVPPDRKTQRQVIVSASRSTLVLHVADGDQLDPTFVSMLFDRSYDVRVIVLASTEVVAVAALGNELIARANKIYLRSIAQRPSAIGWLLDGELRARGSSLCMAELTAANRQALMDDNWQDNWDQLRQAADWLIAIDKHGSNRAAAEHLGVARETFRRWVQDVGGAGLSKPLTVPR